MELSVVMRKRLERKGIYSSLLALRALPKTTVVAGDSSDKLNRIFVTHEFRYVPDFVFTWCDTKLHYRVYIHTANRNSEEKVAGSYAICTVGSKLTAMGFCVLYQFLHKHRAGNREDSVL